jgi:hypothetical protein
MFSKRVHGADPVTQAREDDEADPVFAAVRGAQVGAELVGAG